MIKWMWVLFQTLQVSRSRFIVSVHVSKPTVADLTIVPSNPHWKNQSSIGVVSWQNIIRKV